MQFGLPIAAQTTLVQVQHWMMQGSGVALSENVKECTVRSSSCCTASIAQQTEQYVPCAHAWLTCQGGICDAAIGVVRRQIRDIGSLLAGEA